MLILAIFSWEIGLLLALFFALNILSFIFYPSYKNSDYEKFIWHYDLGQVIDPNYKHNLMQHDFITNIIVSNNKFLKSYKIKSAKFKIIHHNNLDNMLIKLNQVPSYNRLSPHFIITDAKSNMIINPDSITKISKNKNYTY